MYEKSIILVNFIFKVEGNAALFFSEDDYTPMANHEILQEIKKQYRYEAIQVLHRQKERA